LPKGVSEDYRTLRRCEIDRLSGEFPTEGHAALATLRCAGRPSFRGCYEGAKTQSYPQLSRSSVCRRMSRIERDFRLRPAWGRRFRRRRVPRRLRRIPRRLLQLRLPRWLCLRGLGLAGLEHAIPIRWWRAPHTLAGGASCRQRPPHPRLSFLRGSPATSAPMFAPWTAPFLPAARATVCLIIARVFPAEPIDLAYAPQAFRHTTTTFASSGGGGGAGQTPWHRHRTAAEAHQTNSSSAATRPIGSGTRSGGRWRSSGSGNDWAHGNSAPSGNV